MGEAVINKGRLRLPAKASLAYILSSAVARGVSVVGTPIFTRLLSPWEYGLFPLWRSVGALLFSFVSLDIFGGAIYRGFQRYAHRRAEFLNAAIGLFTLLVAIGGGVAFLFFGEFKKLFGLSGGMTLLLFVNLFASGISALSIAEARYDYKYRRVVLINLVNALIVPPLSIILVYFTDYKAEGRIIATVAVSFLLALPLIYSMLKGKGGLYDREIWRYLLHLNLPLLPYHLSVSVVGRIGEISVERIFGREQMGKYSVATSVGLSLTMVTGGLLSALGPWVMRRISAGEYGRIRELLFLLTKTVSLGVVLAAAFAPETLAVIAPSGYRDVLPAVYPLIYSTLPMFLCAAVTSGQTFFEKGFRISLPALASPLPAVGFCVFVLPRLDFRAASFAILASYLLLLCLEIFSFKSLAGESALWGKKTALCMLIAAGYTLLLFALRDNLAVRLVATLPPLLLLPKPALELFRRIKES